jgi:Ca-activated chloride channel homolog
MVAIMFCLLALTLALPTPGRAQDFRPTFRSGVELVTVTASVNDRRGRPVTDLGPSDFELFESGIRRRIVEFRHQDGPISVALLFDVSGSMSVGGKLEAGREAAASVLGLLRPGVDSAALFTFDSSLREAHPFTTEHLKVQSALGGLAPFGGTALYDAIAQTAERVAAEARSARAVIVVTDGIDTSSRLTAAEVSGVASSIDVPVYIITVISPVDLPGRDEGPDSVYGSLADLARWTGGEVLTTTVPAEVSRAARRVVTEMRHQYLLAFEPGGEPGWHRVEVRIRSKDFRVRARSGYFAGESRPATQF